MYHVSGEFYYPVNMLTILRIPRFFVLFLLLLCGMEMVLLWQAGIFAVPFLEIRSMQAVAPNIYDIVFAVSAGLLFALLLTGFSYLVGEAKETALQREASLSGVGLIFSILVLLCPICNVGIFVFFGLAVNLQFLSPYIGVLQGLSLLCLLAAVYFMDYRIRHVCIRCARP